MVAHWVFHLPIWFMATMTIPVSEKQRWHKEIAVLHPLVCYCTCLIFVGEFRIEST